MPAELSWIVDPRTFALAGLISFAIWVARAIGRGTLTPAATVERREKDWAERLAESKEREELWRVAHGKSEDNVRALTAQVDRLTVLGETTVAILQALPRKDPT